MSIGRSCSRYERQIDRLDKMRNPGRPGSGYPVVVGVSQPQNPKYVAILAFAACLILIGGWLARPRDSPASPAPLPSETELEQLARRAERRSLESSTKYFAGIARDLKSSLAYVRGTGLTAIAWDNAHLVTGRMPDDPRARTVTVAISSGEVGAKPIM